MSMSMSMYTDMCVYVYVSICSAIAKPAVVGSCSLPHRGPHAATGCNAGSAVRIETKFQQVSMHGTVRSTNFVLISRWGIGRVVACTHGPIDNAGNRYAARASGVRQKCAQYLTRWWPPDLWLYATETSPQNLAWAARCSL